MTINSTTATSRFAVVIPVYNHSGTVVEVARNACRLGYPVIVVDDGSTDATTRQLQSIREICVLRHPHNRGKGAALLTGMAEAAKTADWAVCLDADGQHDPKDIAALVRAIPSGERPIVIGRRGMMDAAPWTSRFGRKFSNFWVWISSGVHLNDTQSGFRIYPLPEVLDLDVRARRYQYEVEVLAKAAAWTVALIVGGVLVGLVVAVPLTLLGGLREVFKSAVWTLTFREAVSAQKALPDPAPGPTLPQAAAA